MKFPGNRIISLERFEIPLVEQENGGIALFGLVVSS